MASILWWQILTTGQPTVLDAQEGRPWGIFCLVSSWLVNPSRGCRVFTSVSFFLRTMRIDLGTPHLMFLRQGYINESSPEEFFWLSYKPALLLNSYQIVLEYASALQHIQSSDLVCPDITEFGDVLNIALDLQSGFGSSAHISEHLIPNSLSLFFLHYPLS